MKFIAIYLAFFIAAPAMAGSICPKVDSDVVPEFRWQESDFTKEAAEKALQFLSGVLLEKKEYEWVSLPNSQTIISGYIHKREALEAIASESALKEYYVSKFCTFISSHGRVD